MSATINESLVALNATKDSLSTAKNAISDAIIAKGGNVTGGFSSFASAISNLPSGGETPTTPSYVDGGVNFYDYDGTFVAGYTLAEAQALTALPTPPDHSQDEVPLTFQRWNYTLETVKAATRPINVAANYNPTDGKTHLKIRVTKVSGGNITFYFTKTIGTSTLTIDFGNGQTLSDSGNTSVAFTPVPALPIGDYDVTVWLTGSGTFACGQGTSGVACVGGATTAHRNTLIKLFLSDKSGIRNYGLDSHSSLETLSIAYGITSFSSYALKNCSSLKVIAFPTGFTSTVHYVCWNCYALVSVFLPETLLNLGVQSFYNCYSLSNIIIPDSLTMLQDTCLCNCYSLSTIYFPKNLTTIGTQCCQACYSLRKIIFTVTVPTIGAQLFYQCSGIIEYDFSVFTSVPTLSSTNAFGLISASCVIKVPASLYATWKAATNWATYADYLVPV